MGADASLRFWAGECTAPACKVKSCPAAPTGRWHARTVSWNCWRATARSSTRSRYAKTAAGPEIAVTNRGIRRAAPELMQRLAGGEFVDPALVYFRTVPSFEAPAGACEWLNRSLFLASAARLPDKVSLRVFEVN